MSIAISYMETGRTGQKSRTRDALVRAARELMDGGATPTVEEAAAAAAISRATAYRYFPNQRALLTASAPELTERSLLGDAPDDDPEARLTLVVDAILRQLAANEPQLRTMLRLSLEPDAPPRGTLPFRSGRRIGWVGEALEPLRGRLGDAELRRLTIAIAAAVGVDALVWLVDVAGHSRPEAEAVMRWSAGALLRAAVHDGPDS